MTTPDFIEVDRKAHELSSSHGWNAYRYAARLAVEALAEGETEEYEFWRAVEATLRPRDNEPGQTSN